LARKIILILLSLGVLVACGPPRYEKQTVQQDPVLEENYFVRDRDGHMIGYAVKINEHQYRVFTDNGKVIILEDPIFEGNYIIYE
jgi:hypothetical protein